MKYESVVEVTRQMVAQALGEEYMQEQGYIESIPVDKLVEVGKKITEADQTVEKATKALSVILAKREIDEGTFAPLFDGILVDRVEWGGFIERDKIDFADIMDDPVMTVLDGTDYSKVEHTYYQPKVRSKIYEEGKGIMVPISIQRETLTEAFKSYDAMNAFVSKIRSKVRQTLDLAIDRYKAALVAGAIAVSAKATKTAVHLLSEAEAAHISGIDGTTTAEQAMANPEFIKFVAKKIKAVRDNMKATTAAYNNGSWATATAEADSKLYLLSEFTRNLVFDVQSGLFNENDVTFGNYSEVPMWQAAKTSDGDAFEFDNASTIMLAEDPTNKLGIGTDAVTLNGVLGLVFNKKALGLTIYKEYTTSNYTACADFWNEYLHCVTNQILDSDYPIVAFIVDRA